MDRRVGDCGGCCWTQTLLTLDLFQILYFGLVRFLLLRCTDPSHYIHQTLYFSAHVAPDLHLTLRCFSCVCRSPLCCFWAMKRRSEQWLPVKCDCYFESREARLPVVCLSVCRSVCLPSTFPWASRGRRHFRRHRRVTASVAKACRQPAQVGFCVVWQWGWEAKIFT